MSGSSIAEARAKFLELVAEVRPELHRYCARMTGSVFDGEDVVQDTLAKAFFALAEQYEPPPLRAWLFRIAHNTAMDRLRSYESRHVEPVAELPERAASSDAAPDAAIVEAALTAFVALPPVQRSAVALKDVLGLSLEETAAAMETTVPAIKSALTRGRANLTVKKEPAGASVEQVQALRRYAALFNAHDWDGLRALVSEEARLDLVSRSQRKGRPVAEYFTRYAQVAPQDALHAEVGFADGVPVIAMRRPGAARPAYFVRLDWAEDGRIEFIRDFYFVPYIANDARFSAAPG